MYSLNLTDKLKLTVYVNESGSLRSLWNLTGDQGNVWHQATVYYTSSVQHQVRTVTVHQSWLLKYVLKVTTVFVQIVFEVARPKLNDDGVIALDDIYTSCSALDLTTAAPTTEATSPTPSSMDCSFQEGKSPSKCTTRVLQYAWHG